MDEFEDGLLVHDGRMQSCGRRNQRHNGDVANDGLTFAASRFGQLSSKDAVKRGEAEFALAANEI
jgi:hypothetical protein